MNADLSDMGNMAGGSESDGGPSHPQRATAERARQEIGARLRSLRLSHGLSLREAAAAADLSPSFVRLVERGETEIAISRLIRLADAYGAVVADLLADVHEPRVEYVPIENALQVPTNVQGVEILYLASPSWPMEPFLVRLQPGARLVGLRHASEEFVHCVHGAPTLHVGTLVQPMRPGDTILVPSLAEHAYVNDSLSPAILVGAVQRRSDPDAGLQPVWGAAVRQATSQRRRQQATQ